MSDSADDEEVQPNDCQNYIDIKFNTPTHLAVIRGPIGTSRLQAWAQTIGRKPYHRKHFAIVFPNTRMPKFVITQAIDPRKRCYVKSMTVKPEAVLRRAAAVDDDDNDDDDDEQAHARADAMAVRRAADRAGNKINAAAARTRSRRTRPRPRCLTIGL
jgi:hypothetical protein